MLNGLVGAARQQVPELVDTRFDRLPFRVGGRARHVLWQFEIFPDEAAQVEFIYGALAAIRLQDFPGLSLRNGIDESFGIT